MKKQIAVLMAAATAVTTVAPAIANADVSDETKASVSEITSEVKKALDTKYANEKDNGVEIASGTLAKEYLNSRYVVLAKAADSADRARLAKDFETLADSAYKNYKYNFEVKENEYVSYDTKKNTKNTEKNTEWYVVDDANKLGTVLENAGKNRVLVAIVDKGADKDGNASRETTNKHYVKNADDINVDQEVALRDTVEKLVGYADKTSTFVESLKVNGGIALVTDKTKVENAGIPAEINEIKLKLTSDKEYTIKENDDAFDFNEGLKSLDSNSSIKIFDEKGEVTVTQDVLDEIVGFKKIENEGTNKTVDVDIPNGDTDLYVLEDAVEESLGLENIYTREDGYTSEGKDFVNGLVNAKTNEKNTFNFRGTNYEVVKGAGDTVKTYMNKQFDSAVIDKSGDGYKLTFNLKVRDANDTAVEKTLKFVVKGDSQRDLYDVLRDLKGNVEVVSGHFTKLAGSNRYATAIAVSEEQFKPDTAESVVIVGGKAQLDGLAAAPLASAKNAPILLADPNTGLNRDTIKEIDRACSSLKNKTVYIVGGEQSVPAKVAKQLEDEFGAVVKRVAGANRKTTSLEVAKRLNRDKLANKRVFVVGGEGAADAMSVSAVASIKNNIYVTKPGKRVSPILVVDAKGVERDTREFLVKDMGLTVKQAAEEKQVGQVRLIGGEKSLNTQVLRDLKTTAGITDTARISGDNRYDTNVNVIEEFYSNKEETGKIEAKGAIFASGENAYLVDAQTAGSFAANNNLPIVLAGKKLTNDQIDLMKDGGVLDNKRANIYQVGGVVSSDVMKVVVDKLDL